VCGQPTKRKGRYQIMVPPQSSHGNLPNSQIERWDEVRVMRYLSTMLIAAPIAAGLMAAPAAQADWHHGDRDWHGDYHHHDGGGAVAGAVIGLGAAAVLGGLLASQAQQPYYAPPPPVVYAPPPPYYGPQY
jgi:hypothetical protein